MEIVSTIGLITINETLIVQLLSFLIFLFIINRIMFRPLREIMDERENYIQKVKAEIDTAEFELRVISGRIDDQEATVKKEAFVLKEKAQAAGNEAAEAVVDQARQKIGEMKATAEKEIGNMISEARKSIQKESELLTTHIMEKLLERRLNL